MFREIWERNFKEEMGLIQDCLQNHPLIAIDTEFPGCLRETSRDASDDERYENMRFNVDQTKLIQLGITLFDFNGRIGGSWEVNFSDFGDVDDARNPKSIDFLRRNGLNFQNIREHGIRIDGFFSELGWILKQGRRRDITWVTFHGSYDIAYLLKYFTRRSLPVTSERFSNAVARVMGSVYDLKVMASGVHGLGSRLGLESLAQKLQLNRVGTAHHAGSDSELTARVFAKLARICHNVEEEYEGSVYGLANRIVTNSFVQRVLMTTSCYQPPPPPPPQFQLLPPPLLFPPLLRPMFVPVLVARR